MTETAPEVYHRTILDDAAPELTRNYAEALVNVAQNGDDASALLDELDELVADIFVANRRFASMLSSPALSTSDKDRILSETFGGRASDTLTRFLRVLNQHGRLDLLGPVSRKARAILDGRLNRRPVSIRSAVALDESQQSALYDRLAAMLGATPVLSLAVDPSLIGGLVIQVGDDVYDASVKSRLEKLRQGLIEGKTHEISSRRDHFSHSA
ncbi:ATP synthase F1 subunit delta [Isosphaeraceae bacterium EP7]